MQLVRLARERDRARAMAVELERRLARVEALVGEWERGLREWRPRSDCTTDATETTTCYAADLRAALEAPDA